MVRDAYLNALSLCDGDDTIVMIVSKIEENSPVRIKNVHCMITISESMTDLVIDLYNKKDHMFIEKMRRSIDRILMRATGDHDAYIEAVREDVQGTLMKQDEFYESYSKGTSIAFTESGLDDPVEYSSFLGSVVMTDMKRNDALEWIENNRLKYVSASIENRDWTVLNIKIFDAYDQFELHYKRLVSILEAMDAGLVLGESWGKDSAVMFLSVGVYTLRLHTYLEPTEIKKILLGLEYKEDGKRVVDYDLFSKRRKIHWNDVRVDKMPREELGQYYRKQLAEKLGENDLSTLLLLEENIKG